MNDTSLAVTALELSKVHQGELTKSKFTKVHCGGDVAKELDPDRLLEITDQHFTSPHLNTHSSNDITMFRQSKVSLTSIIIDANK